MSTDLVFDPAFIRVGTQLRTIGIRPSVDIRDPYVYWRMGWTLVFPEALEADGYRRNSSRYLGRNETELSPGFGPIFGIVHNESVSRQGEHERLLPSDQVTRLCAPKATRSR